MIWFLIAGIWAMQWQIEVWDWRGNFQILRMTWLSTTWIHIRRGEWPKTPLLYSTVSLWFLWKPDLVFFGLVHGCTRGVQGVCIGKMNPSLRQKSRGTVVKTMAIHLYGARDEGIDWNTCVSLVPRPPRPHLVEGRGLVTRLYLCGP